MVSAIEQGTLSTYNSIISEEGAQWVKLSDADPLAQLCGKLWEENMQDEETK